MADTLLLIEDEALLGAELARHFRREGWEVVHCTELAGARRALEAGEPFVLQPGTADLVPTGDDPLAVAPVVLPSGRIGCVAAACPGEFPERKLRLLAGIANQASLALHIST